MEKLSKSQTQSTVPPEQQLSLTFRIEGMHCASCAARAEKLLQSLEFVRQASVNLATELAQVQLRMGQPSQAFTGTGSVALDRDFSDPAKMIMQKLSDAGFKPTQYKDQLTNNLWLQKDATRMAERKQQGLKLVASAVLTAPLLLPMFFEPFGVDLALPRLWQLLLASIVQFWIGKPFYGRAWQCLKNRNATMDLLVVVGTTAAWALSTFFTGLELWPNYDQTLWVREALHWASSAGHSMPVYFESSAAIFTFVLLGKFLEEDAKNKTTLSLRQLYALRPAMAFVERRGQVNEVPVEFISAGEIVEVKPGGRFPFDVKIVEGIGDVDEALLTGEGLPVPKRVGDLVAAGSQNLNGYFRCLVTLNISESSLSQIISLVENAQSTKAPIQRLADKVSAIFIPTVFVVALFTLLYWIFWRGQPVEGVLNCISVLVIACPCALGLATPTALLVGTSLAAQRGIMIRDAVALERAQSINVVAFDKTGTLTLGQPELFCCLDVKNSQDILVHQRLLSGDVNTQDWSLFVLKLSVAVLHFSEHPLANAAIKCASSMGMEKESYRGLVSHFQALPGQGAIAVLLGTELGGPEEMPTLLPNSNMQLSLAVCNRAWALENTAAEELAKVTQCIDHLEGLGCTLSFLFAKPPSQNWRLLGVLAFRDTLRPQSVAALARLQQAQIRTLILSGDGPAAANHVAKILGISPDRVFSSLRPADKTECIKIMQKDGLRVAFVGDGINDSAALAQADLGIAMAAATDLAAHSASVTLAQDNPLLVLDALQIAKKTYVKIKQGLFWAFLFNSLGIPLAAMGYLSPMVAGAAMACSSVAVVTNALTLRRWKPIAS